LYSIFQAPGKGKENRNERGKKWVKMPRKMGGNRGATLALLFACGLLLISTTKAADLGSESDDFEDGYVEDVQVSAALRSAR